MTAQATMLQLEQAATALSGTLDAAKVTICEDAPTRGRTIVVDELGEAMIELSSDAAHLLAQARPVTEAGTGASREQIWLVVAEMQAEFDAISDCIAHRVTAYRVLSEIERFSRRGGLEWRAWWATSEQAIADCESSARTVRDALHACWYELAATGGVTVDHATVGRVSVGVRASAGEPSQVSSVAAHEMRSAGIGAVRPGHHETRGGHR